MEKKKNTITFNGEEIEILDLSGNEKKKINIIDTIKSKINLTEKQKKMLVIGVPSGLALLLVLFVSIYFITRPPKAVVFKNKIENKKEIETTLDLKGIFINDENNASNDKSDVLRKAVINDGKIYFSYSPSYCSDSEDLVMTCDMLEEKKEECKSNQKNTCKANSKDEKCKEDYCDNLYKDVECVQGNDIKYKNNSICEKFYNNQTEDSELNYRYVLTSKLDGNDLEEIDGFDGINQVTFDYNDKALALIHSELDDAAYKLDFAKNKITKIKEASSILTYPVSNEKVKVLYENTSNNYKLNLYDSDDFKKTKEKIDIFKPDSDHDLVRLDKYDENSYYTMSNYKYDESLESRNNGLYKNGKLIYEFKNSYKDFFIGGNNIVIVTTNGYNVRIIKIDKETYEDKGAKIIYKSNRQIDEIKFIAYGNDNLVYLSVDGSIYTYNEADDILTKTSLSFKDIESYGTYNNYIYFYTEIDEVEDYPRLVLYNTFTKEDYTIQNVVYYTIKDGKIYTIESEDTDLKLYQYNID